nr:type IV pilin protein [Acinetobacter sp. YH12098]
MDGHVNGGELVCCQKHVSKKSVRTNLGYTLMELMIVVVIIGALIAFIYPQYNQYAMKSKRVEAQAALQELSQKLAIYKVTAGSFKNLDFDGVYGESIPASVKSNYNFKLTDESGLEYVRTGAKVSTWMLTAEAINPNAGNLTLNWQGEKCWYKESNICDKWE